MLGTGIVFALLTIWPITLGVEGHGQSSGRRARKSSSAREPLDACESTSPERQHVSSLASASTAAITFSSSPVGTPAPIQSIRTPSCV